MFSIHQSLRREMARLGGGGKLARLKHRFIRTMSSRQRIEQEISRFKTTLDQTRDCVFMFDSDTYEFLYVNRGAVEQVGYSADELMGMTPLDIKPEIDTAEFDAMVAPLKDGIKGALTFETVHERKDGSLVPVEIVLQHVSPAGGDPRFVAIVRDVTERRRAEEEVRKLNEELERRVLKRTRDLTLEIAERKRAEETYLRLSRQTKTILDTAGDGIYGIDREGRVTFINPAAAKMLGWKAGDLIGKGLHGIIHHTRADGTPYPVEECPAYLALEDGVDISVSEELFWRQDGTSFPGAHNITPDRETGIGGWSDGDLVSLFKMGMKPDFDFVGGAMGEVVANTTSRLTDADLAAVITYLRSLSPVRHRVRRKKEGQR